MNNLNDYSDNMENKLSSRYKTSIYIYTDVFVMPSGSNSVSWSYIRKDVYSDGKNVSYSDCGLSITSSPFGIMLSTLNMALRKNTNKIVSIFSPNKEFVDDINMLMGIIKSGVSLDGLSSTYGVSSECIGYFTGCVKEFTINVYFALEYRSVDVLVCSNKSKQVLVDAHTLTQQQYINKYSTISSWKKE